MKISSAIILFLVLLLAVGIQSWIVVQKFATPEELTSVEAILTGTTIDVGTPVSGLVGEVFVTEGERVSRNQELFTIIPLSPDQAEAAEERVVRAERPGVVTAISATAGTFAQSSEELAKIIDVDREAVRVRAKLHVPPAMLVYLPDIRPQAAAVVQAPYLNGGQEMAAVIESVESVYDATKQTIGVELKIVDLPPELQRFPLGLPLEVTLQLTHKRPLELFIHSVTQKFVSLAAPFRLHEI